MPNDDDTGGEDGVEESGVKNLFNTRGSKRRSRLGVGIAVWDSSKSWSNRNLFCRTGDKNFLQSVLCRI